MDFNLIREYASLIRDIVLILVTFPALFLIRKFYKQQVNTLKSQIDLLSELKPDKVVSYIRSYKELSIIDRERYLSEIEIRESKFEKYIDGEKEKYNKDLEGINMSDDLKSYLTALNDKYFEYISISIATYFNELKSNLTFNKS